MPGHPSAAKRVTLRSILDRMALLDVTTAQPPSKCLATLTPFLLLMHVAASGIIGTNEKAPVPQSRQQITSAH